MTKEGDILISPPIKNIYYMLTYAFNALRKPDYKNAATEDCEDLLDLLAKILVLGLNRLIKQGFFRDYIRVSETSSSIRGKINITQSIKTLSFLKKQLNISYNEYSMNNYLNQIIKTTLILLIRSSDIKKDTKNNIKRILIYFSNVDSLEVKFIDWNIRYYRNNQEYKMIIDFCYLIINGLLQTNEDGSYKLLNFSKSLMEKIYEEFLFRYFKEEYKNILVERNILNWPLDKGSQDDDNLLPQMRTDIVLSNNEDKFLIMDAKYYNDVFSNYYDKDSIRSKNLYQIFTYVKSMEYKHKNVESHKVSGMLLYACTDGTDLDVHYLMDGNNIIVKTLDLNKKNFDDIKGQLNEIANCFLEGKY